MTARIKLNAPGLPLEESVTEKVTEQFERDEKEQEEDMNATSGNDSEALQQMPIRAEENQGSKQVQKNRPHGRSAMSAAGED